MISSYQFDKRDEAENETISEYIVALQKVSINCAFGDENQLNKRLRNWLVVGAKEDVDDNWQPRNIASTAKQGHMQTCDSDDPSL